MGNKRFWLLLLMLFLTLQATVVLGQQVDLDDVSKEFQLQDFLMFLVVYALITLGLMALCLLVNIYFARPLSRIVEYSADTGGKAFLLGLGNGVSIFVVLILLGQFQGNPIQILIVPLLLVGGVGILLGLFAESQLIGQRVMECRAIREPSSVAIIVAGFLVIAFGSLIPIIGQLALLLIVLKGFGAVIGAVFRRKSRRNKEEL
ncbi:hypothetical protein ACFL6S_22045 [Candidatus Poribacteria bacterium]